MRGKIRPTGAILKYLFGCENRKSFGIPGTSPVNNGPVSAMITS